MKIREVAPGVDLAALLAGAQFIDAFAIDVEDRAFDARNAAKAMLGRSPRWIGALMGLRNFVVAPFGLKTSAQSGAVPRETIGIFPILTETPDRLVAGFNDKHLDFRLVVDVATSGVGQRVTATTLVKTHNRLGRIYLAIILPFHRLIVPAMLRQIAT
jgi:Protein of unknown function (DUF2867)